MLISTSKSLIKGPICYNTTKLIYFQGYRSVDGLKCTIGVAMNNKKAKSVWREVSTQYSSNEGEKVQSAAAAIGKKLEGGDEVVESEVSEVSSLGANDIQGGGGVIQSGNVGLPGEAEAHSVSVQVAGSLIRFVKGKWGSTQKQIEEDTGVKLIFPRSKTEDVVVIKGASVESITKASERIQVIVEKAIKSPTLDYSHFISLPLAIHPDLVEKLVNFQHSILGSSDSTEDAKLGAKSNGDTSDEDKNEDDQIDRGLDVAVKLKVEDKNEHGELEMNTKASKLFTLSDMGIDRSTFIKPKTFHLTVLMLKLWNKERVQLATDVLQSVSLKIINVLGSRPVSVRLKGLECMRGSLAKARVLYIPVEVIGGEDRLLRACQVITDAYVEAGLVLEKDAQQKLKLHGTVMNARHRKRNERAKKYDSFDARGIVKQFGLEEWGEYLIPEVHLSQRFMFQNNGYYHCCASIPFPRDKKAE